VIAPSVSGALLEILHIATWRFLGKSGANAGDAGWIFAASLAALCALHGASAQRESCGLGKVAWSTIASFWTGFGYWAISVPFSLTSPLPSHSVMGFLHPFPFTFISFDVAQDLAVVLVISLGSGLLVGAGSAGLEAVREWLIERRDSASLEAAVTDQSSGAERVDKTVSTQNPQKST
jgi:hypothetical protein